MVIRRLQKSSIVPQNANVPVFQSWIVESDRLSNINDPDFPDDIEVERTPFINPHDLDPKGGRVIEGQAETFIGRKTLAQQWDPVAADAATRIDLNVLTSSNPLFVDYQLHNPNVFSIVDNFQYKDGNGNTAYLQKAKCDYFTIGWHSIADHDPLTTAPGITAPFHSDRLDACSMQMKDATSKNVSDWLASTAPSRVLCHTSMYDVEYDHGGTPGNVLADTIGQKMRQQQSIAVGVDTLDVSSPRYLVPILSHD